MARVHFLNVKNGDCSIIQHDNDHVTMIDVCNANDIIEERVADESAGLLLEKSFGVSGVLGNFNQKKHPTNPVAYLKSLGCTTIFRYIQTHPDMDHMDGLAAINRNFEIINFWDTDNNEVKNWTAPVEAGYKKEDWDCYQRLRKSTSSPKSLQFLDGASAVYFREDANGPKQDDYLQILSPTQALIDAAKQSKKWNDSSYVLLYQIAGKKILFCGDADQATLDHLVADHPNEIANLDLLIAPHHGRDSDKDFSFLDTMKPRVTFFGNGKSSEMAYNEWTRRGLTKFTNNQTGDLLVELSPQRFTIYASYKTFVDTFRANNNFTQTKPHPQVEGMWMLLNI